MWRFFSTCTHPGWSRCAPAWGGLSWGTPFPSAEGSIQDVTLGSSYSFYMIQGLEPGTEHTVTINPIFGDVEGPVVSGKATTGERPAAGVAFSPCGLRGGGTELVSLSVTPLRRWVWGPLRCCWDLDGTGQLFSPAVASSTVQMLKVSEISVNSLLVSWDSVAGATGYRVAWGPTPGEIRLCSPWNGRTSGIWVLDHELLQQPLPQFQSLN